MINPITGATETAASTASGKAAAALAGNFDAFLKLLTAQLQHQDPLKPMDSSDFTQQLVQFSGVEQAISTNKNLEKLLSLVGGNFAANLVNYLGKSVTVESDQTALKAGKAEWAYSLPSAAAQTTLKILDSSGRLMWTASGATAAGEYVLPWDGRNAAGQQMPDGTYRLVVEAVDAQANAITSRVVVRGTVTGVESSPDGALINVDGQNVPLEKILSVRVAQPAPPA